MEVTNYLLTGMILQVAGDFPFAGELLVKPALGETTAGEAICGEDRFGDATGDAIHDAGKRVNKPFIPLLRASQKKTVVGLPRCLVISLASSPFRVDENQLKKLAAQGGWRVKGDRPP